MRSVSPTSWILPVAITVLALADGVLHFSLDFILFRGNIFGSGRPPGPPPGAAPGGAPRPPGPPPLQLPLPLNELFLLTIIGYVILIAAFWLSPRFLGRWRWLVDLVMIVYAAVILLAWVEIGRPNPMGLGYLSKGIEILLIAALAAHLWIALKSRGVEVQPVRRGA